MENYNVNFCIDPSIKDSNIILSLSDNIKLISWDCSLPLNFNHVTIIDNGTQNIPSILLNQHLQYLSTPSKLLRKIYSNINLEELETLIINKGDLRVKINLIFNRVSSLSSEGKAAFKKANFPALKKIYCKYDISTLNELINYDTLEEIGFKTVNYDIFEKLSAIKSLHTLRIDNGKLSDITNIYKINQIKSLALFNLAYLTDLSPLKELKYLECLRIGYCKHIHNWNFLLNLRRLKILNIPVSSYKDRPPKPIIEELVNKGVVGISI